MKGVDRRPDLILQDEVASFEDRNYNILANSLGRLKEMAVYQNIAVIPDSSLFEQRGSSICQGMFFVRS